MSLLSIVYYGDPILRQKAQHIDEITLEIKQLAGDMIETMQIEHGIGLAAPQVGESLALLVVDCSLIDVDGEPRAFVNPRIHAAEDRDVMEEGCLSLPTVRADVARPDRIDVEYTTLDGETRREWVDGMLARVLQHEIDHLEGIFFVDRISPMKRKLLAKKLRKIVEGKIDELIAEAETEDVT